MKLKSALTLADGVAGGGSGYGHATEAAGKRSTGENSFHWLRQFVTRQIVEVAPEDLAICEFDCRKTQCTKAEWEA